MRVSRVPAVLLTVALGACGSDTPAPTAISRLTAGADRASTASPVTRPFSGKCEVTFNPPPFPLPPVFEQTDVGTCHFTELGVTAFYGVQTINFAAGTQAGWRTFTAANGDVLRVEHTGTSGPSGPGLVSFRATSNVVGGTGRFANATGHLSISGVANLITHVTVSTFEGSISYNASARSER